MGALIRIEEVEANLIGGTYWKAGTKLYQSGLGGQIKWNKMKIV